MLWFGATDQLDRIERKLDRALVMLTTVLKQEQSIMAAIDDALANAESAAKSESDAEDAVVALLKTISAQIAALKAAGTDPATVARIQALADGLNAKAAALGAAVVENTPAAG